MSHVIRAFPSRPSGANYGDMYKDAEDGFFYIYDGHTWLKFEDTDINSKEYTGIIDDDGSIPGIASITLGPIGGNGGGSVNMYGGINRNTANNPLTGSIYSMP